MFEAFQRNFAPDAERVIKNASLSVISKVSCLAELIRRFGGASFNHGLYRVVCATDLDEWNQRISVGFPQFQGRITCFAFDWLGRAFAVDSQRTEAGQFGVVMFEPGTGEALEIPSNLETFHDKELVEFGEEALAKDFHRRWLASDGAAPKYGQCIGYRKPLFLGGADELGNLELTDIDVYWHFMSQLIVETKGLPPGTQVRVNLT